LSRACQARTAWRRSCPAPNHSCDCGKGFRKPFQGADQNLGSHSQMLFNASQIFRQSDDGSQGILRNRRF
jgi:hypothetical protein